MIKAASTTALVLAGGSYLATKSPSVEYYENFVGTGLISSAQNKVLVTYASKYGSTGGVAKEIANTLNNNGFLVDVRLITKSMDLSAYSSIIIGSPVYVGKWMEEAYDFVQSNRKILSNMNVAYFLTSMTLGASKDEVAKQEIEEILNSIEKEIPEVKTLHKGFFGGAIDYSKMSLAMKTMLKIMPEDVKEGDFRDWGVINSWAEEIGKRIV